MLASGEPTFDVVIVGASFAGLTLAHHLPSSLRVLVIDAKPSAGSTVESTGLITTRTREEFVRFFPVDQHITNPITAICVVAPGFRDRFVSSTGAPWIYQTDTKALVRALADALPPNVTLRTGVAYVGCERNARGDVASATLRAGASVERVKTKFLVGADGSHSRVAQTVPGLDRNRKFLFGFEQVFFGEVFLGDKPAETITHFWFGEFSLGYGGWISPTTVDGRKAFRVGLAKLEKDRGDAKALLDAFVQRLVDEKMVAIEGDPKRPDYVFGSLIPIGGTLRRIHAGNALLLGDAAGFCGAFAADGIKGSVVSGKEAAPLVAAHLGGDASALGKLRERMNAHDGLIGYYARQRRYRMVWDLMRRDRTFRAMWEIIDAERETFLDQFCDSKDKRRSLTWTVLKWRHVPKLVRYAWCIVRDQLRV
jgi:flavin-dependent dehydrogenase